MNAPAGLPQGSAQARFLTSEADVVWSGDRFQLHAKAVDVFHDLTPAQALILLLFAERGDEEEVARFAASLGASACKALAQVLARFPTYLTGRRARAFDVQWWGERVTKATARPRRQMAAPASITWMMTLECNRRCPYCFYRILPVRGAALHWPCDAGLRGEHVDRVLAELARIGTADLYLTGGEPLLRPDVPEIVAKAASRGIRVSIVTKYPLDEHLAEDLARAGLHQLTISLDDDRPEVARRLTGTSGYPEEAFRAIGAALSAGLSLEVNAVLTALNADALPRLAARLEGMGCRHMSISAMQAPYFRAGVGNSLLAAAPVNEVVDAARAATTGAMHIEGGASGGSADRRPCGSDLVCEVGTRSLHILPNGDVTRCHYVPSRPDLIVGSLLQQSVVEIWRGDALGQWRDPSRSAFQDTACHDCGAFDNCNGRGRCIASALLDHGRASAPDAFCTRL